MHPGSHVLLSLQHSPPTGCCQNFPHGSTTQLYRSVAPLHTFMHCVCSRFLLPPAWRWHGAYNSLLRISSVRCCCKCHSLSEDYTHTAPVWCAGGCIDAASSSYASVDPLAIVFPCKMWHQPAGLQMLCLQAAQQEAQQAHNSHLPKEEPKVRPESAFSINLELPDEKEFVKPHTVRCTCTPCLIVGTFSHAPLLMLIADEASFRDTACGTQCTQLGVATQDTG